jgi:hypothetical protein
MASNRIEPLAGPMPLVAAAVDLSKARGGDWLHVDYDDELTPF